MGTVRVGHVNRDEGIYIGRRFRGFPASDLANPFPISALRTRESAIAAFEAWFTEMLAAGDPAVTQAVDELVAAVRRGDVTLVCWCRDLAATEPACHGDVIARVVMARASA